MHCDLVTRNNFLNTKVFPDFHYDFIDLNCS